jgi:hypothetical protein
VGSGDVWPDPAQMSVAAPLQDTGDREMTLLFAGQSAALGRDMSAGALVEAVAGKRGGDWGWEAVIVWLWLEVPFQNEWL